MGVPALFRFLSRKYPSFVSDAVEISAKNIDGTSVPVDTTQPNPNGMEFDNLYLDMNGIIHPCTHPEDRPAPKSEDEMFVLIFEYIDRIFAIVRPRRLLYMAVDGVAPRAKMNQQRSRRFRASQEASEKEEEIAQVRQRLEQEGIPLPPKKDSKDHFDSNCITPGTPFMARLADALKYYIHDRCSSDPGWQKIEVILSDANVPGEGEHKVMDFIRRQRASKSHDPNTVHVLCGADADLIMLGLATHEPNFYIIREEFIPNQPRPCDLCGQYGHDLKDCAGLAKEEASECTSTPLQKEKNFIFVRLPVLREYLEKELQIPNPPVPIDFERVIDDWVFLCFFVGNDFLPHLPSLEIRENAIDRLIKLYKDMFYKLRGYLTDSGEVFMERVQVILNGLGEVEDEIFKTRQEKELIFRRREKARRRRERGAQAPSYVPSSGSLIAPLMAPPSLLSGMDTRRMARDDRIKAMESQTPPTPLRALGASRKRPAEDSDEEEEPKDEVRLWEAGWKDRYYKSKFGVDGSDVAFRRKVAWAYVEGLCWVLKYYYQGCVSWDWYYPYHYAPFASDFDTVAAFVPDFSARTEPFKPMQQLMSVFPAASRGHVPVEWQDLMTSEDSPLIDFYPIDFKVDLNGKKYAWQGVALLPFVDEQRLLETLNMFEVKLSAAEVERNSLGPNRIFVGRNHPACKFFEQLYEDKKNGGSSDAGVLFDSSLAFGLAGLVRADEHGVLLGNAYKSPLPLQCCPDIPANSALGVVYEDPQFEPGYVFSAKRLPDAKEAPRTLKPSDWNDQQQRYRPQIGMSSSYPRASVGDAGQRMIAHAVSRVGRSDFGSGEVDNGWGDHRSAPWRRGDGGRMPGGGRGDRRNASFQAGDDRSFYDNQSWGGGREDQWSRSRSLDGQWNSGGYGGGYDGYGGMDYGGAQGGRFPARENFGRGYGRGDGDRARFSPYQRQNYGSRNERYQGNDRRPRW